MNKSSFSILYSSLKENAERFIHLGEGEETIDASELLSLRSTVINQTKELLPCTGDSVEEEARICLLLLKGKSAFFGTQETEDLFECVLNRCYHVLPKLGPTLLKCQLLIYCYGEVLEEELAEEAKEIMDGWGERELSEEELKAKNLYQNIVFD